MSNPSNRPPRIPGYDTEDEVNTVNFNNSSDNSSDIPYAQYTQPAYPSSYPQQHYVAPMKKKSFFARHKALMSVLIALAVLIPCAGAGYAFFHFHHKPNRIIMRDMTSQTSSNDKYSNAANDIPPETDKNQNAGDSTKIAWTDPGNVKVNVDTEFMEAAMQEQDIVLEDINTLCTFHLSEPYRVDNDLYLTLQIKKQDKYKTIGSAVYVSALDAATGEFLDQEWIDVSMDFDLDTFWVTVVFTDIPQSFWSEPSVKFELESSGAVTAHIQEYDFLSDNPNASDEDLYQEKLILDEYDEQLYTINSLGSGRATDPLVFTIECPNAYEPNDRVFCTVDILYKKDDKIVYAQLFQIDGDLSNYKRTDSFYPSHKIPDFDSVEIIYCGR